MLKDDICKRMTVGGRWNVCFQGSIFKQAEFIDAVETGGWLWGKRIPVLYHFYPRALA